MFVLHVDLLPKPDQAAELIAAYREVFRPAIIPQPGFRETNLLQARPPAAPALRLVIVFESEQLQKEWVATELHKTVWARMQASVDSVSAAFFSAVQ